MDTDRTDKTKRGLIRTRRMDLQPLPLVAYRLLLNGETARVEEILGLKLNGSRLAGLAPIVRYRAEQLEKDPTQLPWLVHLMVDRERHVVVGDIGFHGPPSSEGWVEMGYTVIEPYRREGFAIEAIRGLAQWASAEPGVTKLRLSISPTNVASLGLAAKLGLVQVGSHMDEIDGEELIFEGPLPVRER
jgi:[ribosomal protein S5]-alanine N-acetyltransferase